jgi:hypothetical protein
MRQLFAFTVLVLVSAAGSGASRPPEVNFDRRVIDDGASETCAFADINGDRKIDIVSGEYWYEGPGWVPHKFRDLPFTESYIDNFSDLPIDADLDGRVDIVSCSYFSHRLAWWKNPGPGKEWKEQTIQGESPVEFAFLLDLDNDGRQRELLPQFGDERAPLSWYDARNGAWSKHVISPKSYGHGIGAGDVNRDGRNDVITPKGWFEAPAAPADGEWQWHPDFDLGTTGFIHVLDVNGDGRNDLVSSLAHNYGIFWMERTVAGEWKKHVIDDTWSQPHAVVLVDVNGDGKVDLLTGKRYMAHNGRDPGEREPLGLYWYESLPGPNGDLVWVRHVIDYSTRAGGGIQIAAADINGDGRVDFAAGGKSGLFLFLNRGIRNAVGQRPSTGQKP